MADEGKKVRERVDAKTAFAGYLHWMRSATEGFGDNPFPSDEHDREPENATLEERVMVILGCVADVLACRRPHSRRALDLGVAFYLDEPLLLLLLRLGAVVDAQGLEDADGLDDFYPLSWSTLFAGASPLASWTWSRGRLGLGAAWCWDAHDQEF